VRVQAGYLLDTLIHSTDAQDCDGAPYLIIGSHDAQRSFARFFADFGYAGLKLHAAIAHLDRLASAIVRRCNVLGVVVLPRRSLVQHAFAWLDRCRRVAKDWGQPLQAPKRDSLSSSSCE
jgi:transposase